MKTLHPVSSCLALLFIVACGTGRSDGLDVDEARDPATAEAQTEQPPSAESAPGSAPTVHDKATCPAGCVKISTAAPIPACCNCNGHEHLWKRSTWSPTTWLCQ